MYNKIKKFRNFIFMRGEKTMPKLKNPLKTSGTVTAVKKLWWIKVNTKPIRTHALDGALFPHAITVKYSVNGIEHIKRKYVRAKLMPPTVGDTVDVYYLAEKPGKCKILF